MDYYQKYLKYKLKYIDLKNSLGGAILNENDKIYYTNNLSVTDSFYLNQNIYSYYINSSHNTYLPFDQVKGTTSVCYYKLQSFTYFGGCFEIDTIRSEKDDIIITHLPTNKKTLKLSSILKVIVEALKIKKERGIKSGPVILTFDNKGLKTKEDYTIFWNVLKKGVPADMLQDIDNKYDLRTIPIEKMSNKILLRWGENNKCTEKECKSKNILSPDIIGVKFDYIKTKDHWIHILKSSINFKKEVSSESNYSVSTNTPKKDISYPINLNLVINTQRNILRMYPHWSNILSGNYNNMIYFRDGGQIIALNLQSSSDSVLYNNAVFLKAETEFCTPNEIRKASTGRCNKGISNGEPIAYRLKPIWLLGLLPYPELYDLEIKIKGTTSDDKDVTSGKYNEYKIKYGLNSEKVTGKISNSLIIKNINVTVPFFILSIEKSVLKVKSSYKNGCEFEWNYLDVNKPKTKKITLYKQEKTLFQYNDLSKDINDKDRDLDCDNSKLLQIKNKANIDVEYTWKPSQKKGSGGKKENKDSKKDSKDSKKESKDSKKEKVDSDNIQIYNKIISELRNSGEFKGKEIKDYLADLNLLIKYQDELNKKCKELFKQKSDEPKAVQTEDDISVESISKEVSSIENK